MEPARKKAKKKVEEPDEEEEEEEEEEELQLKVDWEGRVVLDGGTPPNYNFRSFPTLVSKTLGDKGEALEKLLADCKVAFTARASKSGEYSQGETFWVAAGREPKTALESLALAIFNLHAGSAKFEPEKSGAEWWTQVIDADDDIGWHWDRDYTLEADTGFQLHPHVATVTYLSNLGAPTVIVEAVEEDGNPPLSITTAHLSMPRMGKHISFDGRWLHAAPADLKDAFLEAGVSRPKGAMRTTFLVNVWLNHRPVSTAEFKDSSALSAAQTSSLSPLATPPEEDAPTRFECKGGGEIFEWSFGGKDGEESEEEEEEEEEESEEKEDGSRRQVRLMLPVDQIKKAKSTSFSIALKPGLAQVAPLAVSA